MPPQEFLLLSDFTVPSIEGLTTDYPKLANFLKIIASEIEYEQDLSTFIKYMFI